MNTMAWLSNPELLVAFLTLTMLELILGIDNIVFISILADRLPPEQRRRARTLGLFLAMFFRLGLLFLLAWLVGLTQPLFSVLGEAISGRDLIMLGGGLFLLWKSTSEIHHLLEGRSGSASEGVKSTFAAVILQILLIDMVFSLDSIITAVGMVKEVEVMMAAVVTSVALMMLFAGAIGEFVSAHPTVKMLALAFLFMIGMVLIADGLDHHVPKAYVYFAMAFSMAVELLNLRAKRAAQPPVELHERYLPEDLPDKN